MELSEQPSQSSSSIQLGFDFSSILAVQLPPSEESTLAIKEQERPMGSEVIQQESDRPDAAMREPATRMIKIEADGDHWKGDVRPKIRLRGRWLERAGF